MDLDRSLSSHRLWYEAPASGWSEGMPVGNGRIGAMVWGGGEIERLSLNEDTLWSGKPFVSDHTKSREAYYAARRLVWDDRQGEACTLLEREFGDQLTQQYLPLGELTLHMAHGPVQDYRRELSLETGIVTVTYSVCGVRFTREIFVSYPDQVLCVRISAEQPGQVGFTAALKGKLRCTQGACGDTLTLSGNCPMFRLPRGASEKHESDYTYGETDEDRGVGYFAALRILPQGGALSESQGVLTLAGADSAVLCFAVRTSFAGWNHHPVLEGKPYIEPCTAELARASALPYASLRRRHLEDYQALYGRTELRLPVDPLSLAPTDQRLLRHAAGERDRSLYALLFHFGRYLTIASSRPGTQVTNLQGIWSETILPPWGCNCTININTEMNYWPTLKCDLRECWEPLHRAVTELSQAGRATARDYYGAPGFVSHSATDLWRLTSPHSNGIPGSTQWGFWYMSSGWLARMLWDEYAYTGDIQVLREIWPVLDDAASFYAALLIQRDGELILSPCTSPENNYLIDRTPYPIDVTTEMSMAIVRDLFRCAAEAGKLLGAEAGARYQALLPRLRRMCIGADGRIREWYEDRPDWDPHHRHTSQLYGLYPGREITPETPERMAAAAEVLERRGDSSTGWSTAWKVNFWAKLRNGDRAERLLDMELRPVADTMDISTSGGSFLSLLCAHPPFQIDGNFGSAAGIAEMLLRTEGDQVELLPALPGDWETGSIDGLRLQGGGRISFAWERGRVTRCRITGGCPAYQVTQNGTVVPVIPCLVRREGRPEEERDAIEERVYDCLEALEIPFGRVDHEPAWTMEDCAAAEAVLGAPVVKNLFLTNRQHTQFYLLLMPADKPFLTKELSHQIGSARLSFAGPAELKRYLGVTPGSASVLGLMNDAEAVVELLMDEELADLDALGCHPCRNTTCVSIPMDALLGKFLPATRHCVRYVTLSR